MPMYVDQTTAGTPTATSPDPASRLSARYHREMSQKNEAILFSVLGPSPVGTSLHRPPLIPGINLKTKEQPEGPCRVAPLGYACFCWRRNKNQKKRSHFFNACERTASTCPSTNFLV